MRFPKTTRNRIALALVIVLGIGLAYLTWGYIRPLPQITTFRSTHFSFDYPRTYYAKEYASGVVSVGIGNDVTIVPYIEVDRYQSDPDEPTPASFDAFMKMQASVLCGADGPIESVRCTQVGVTPYTSPKGIAGEMLDLTLVRTNLTSGTTSSSTYGPLYVFNTTQQPTSDSPLRYSGVFVYPSLSAYLHGTTTPELMQQIIGSLALPDGVSSVK